MYDSNILPLFESFREQISKSDLPAPGPLLGMSTFLQWLKEMSMRNAVRFKKTVKREAYLEKWLKNMVCWTDASCLSKTNDFTKN